MVPTPTDREAMIAQATIIHDETCLCERKYLMSCPNMANAILSLSNVLESAPDNLNDVIRQCLSDSERWFPKIGNLEVMDRLVHDALAYNGEAGELANEVKKVMRGDAALEERYEKIVSEAIDGFIYLCNIFGVLDVDVFAEYAKKRAFNEKRFARG